MLSKIRTNKIYLFVILKTLWITTTLFVYCYRIYLIKQYSLSHSSASQPFLLRGTLSSRYQRIGSPPRAQGETQVICLKTPIFGKTWDETWDMSNSSILRLSNFHLRQDMPIYVTDESCNFLYYHRLDICSMSTFDINLKLCSTKY